MNFARNARACTLLALSAGTAIALAGGCAKPDRAEPIAGPARAVQPPPRFENTTRPVTERLDLAAAPQARRQPGEAVAALKLKAPAEHDRVQPSVTMPNAGELIRVKYAAADAAMRDVLNVLLGEYLGRSFVLAPGLAALPPNLTFSVDEEMTRADLLDFVGALGLLYNFAIEEGERGVLMVRQGDVAAKASNLPILTGRAAVDNDLQALRLRRLRHVAAPETVNVLKEVLSPGAKIANVGDMLVLVDTTRQLSKASRLLAALDVPAFEGVELVIFRLAHRSPDEAAKVLDAITNGARINNQANPLVTFVPVPASDRLLAISRDPTLTPTIRTFVEQVDSPGDSAPRGRYLYRVQNGSPDALSKLVSDVFADKIETQADKGKGGSRIRLTTETNERLLIITATAQDYADVLATLRAVDRPRQQVFLSSIIAEVNMTNNLQFGVEYFLRVLDKQGVGISEITGTPGLPGAASGAAFFTAADGVAIVKALQNESQVDILSQPQVIVQSEKTGIIQVGGRVPIAKSSTETGSSTGGTTLPRTDVGYEDTGVKLEIRPTVNESGYVTLQIKQEIKETTAASTDTTVAKTSPEFITRNLDTTVTVPHGRTLLLGGIIRTQRNQDVTKIPIAGDIPLLGQAFRSTADTTSRRELILAITPYIVTEPEQAADRLSDFLQSAAAVRVALFETQNELPVGALFSPSLVSPPQGDQPPPQDQTPPAPPAPGPSTIPSPTSEPAPAGSPAAQPS
ncbi:MAG: hypothetical protein IBJ11_10705 [Phycisphaerales bacterium]|nr:hypothetical protein [Phycisphaerales bacterium]